MDLARLFKFLLPVVLLMGLLTVFGERGLVRYYRLARERDEINSRIERFNRENQYLKRELSSLRNDRHRVEDIARKELGFVREGETVYRFRDGSR